MEEIGRIYLLTSPSGKQYVGQTRMKGNRRMVIHKANAKRGCTTVLGRAIRKYDMEAFKQETLCEAPVSELNTLEIHYIAKLETMVPNGYNLISGGGVGRVCSDVTRKKMSKARKGSKNPNFGKECSKETREKISAANTGWQQTEDTKRRISETLKEKYKDIPLKHGTLSAYSRHHCKCEPCLEVGRAYSREHHKKRKLSDDPINHGTRSGFGRGCLCEECRAAKKASRTRDTPITHGKLDSYNSRGCRCLECKAVKSAHAKQQYRDLRASTAPIKHGTTTGYKRGCRCAECKARHSKINRDCYDSKKKRAA